jgi:hypothetical protein
MADRFLRLEPIKEVGSGGPVAQDGAYQQTVFDAPPYWVVNAWPTASSLATPIETCHCTIFQAPRSC